MESRIRHAAAHSNTIRPGGAGQAHTATWCVALAACLALSLALAVGAAAAAPAAQGGGTVLRQAPFHVRAFPTKLRGRWIGNAIAYGPHRDGQSPTGAQPTRAQVGEDLWLMAPHWNLFRLYGARGAAESILAVIRAGQQLSALIDDRNFLRLQIRHSSSNQVAQRANLIRRRFASWR